MNKILTSWNLKFRSTYLGLLILLFACNNSKPADKPFQKFTYSIDTLTIDSKEHLLFVGYGIPMVKLSEKERFLHFYDPLNHAIEKIDLENKEGVNTLYLDKEGPNGVLDHNRFDYIPISDSSYRFFTKKNFKDLSLSNNLIKTSKPIDSLVKISEENETQFSSLISSNLQYLYGLTSDFNQEQKLVWIDLGDYTLKESDLDSMKYRENYKISLDGMIVSGMIGSTFLNEKLLVYHSDGIDLYEIDPKSGNKRFINNRPEITPQRKAGNFPRNVEKSEAVKALELESLEIDYKEIVFDEENQRFYRIASQQTENKGRTKVYLLIFDHELNLISELDLSSLDMKNSANYFTRKGKLYFLNKETEDLEFFVFDLKSTISNE
ncbi:DUF4221 family protein [Algoriphagus zhangzhouensis]|uniref:TolB-like 6-blade propeller-like n=1 Tax=Algoriphagus zhangzhouensis TaxID=1073327 RepID=A0A1M7ZB99_9BACT|nr:DUF4221 family protein [Algoriphagus zhangzhouensis]TDY46929.1 uncharacterized protein DUF4221 [Algoriphagus zhangzhouensis]SHO62112.1 protein of unknown function [Algoriphagus zhangzhouensis]